jgi:hypothetical protein
MQNPKKKRFRRFLSAVFALLFISTINVDEAQSAIIQADATGANNYTTTDFWGVGFASGSGFIQSVTFDLSADADAYFDFDGAATYGDVTYPVIGALTGLVEGDIGFALSGSIGGDPLRAQFLTFNFAPDSFGVGDIFRFSADTENFVGDALRPGDISAAALSSRSFCRTGPGALRHSSHKATFNPLRPSTHPSFRFRRRFRCSFARLPVLGLWGGDGLEFDTEKSQGRDSDLVWRMGICAARELESHCVFLLAFVPTETPVLA